MTYKEFYSWVQQRCNDGIWGPKMAQACINVIAYMETLPRWKRWWEWRKIRKDIKDTIVDPINNAIERYGK